MTGSELRLSMLIHLPTCTFKVTIATDNLFSFWIPDNKLLIAILTSIEFIDIHCFARSTSCFTESYLAQTPNLFHNIGCVMRCDNINLIMTLVSHTKLKFRSQFLF